MGGLEGGANANANANENGNANANASERACASVLRLEEIENELELPPEGKKEEEAQEPLTDRSHVLGDPGVEQG